MKTIFNYTLFEYNNIYCLTKILLDLINIKSF